MFKKLFNKPDPYSVEGLERTIGKILLTDPLGVLILAQTGGQLQKGKIARDDVELIVNCLTCANIKDEAHRSALIDKALHILKLKIVYSTDADGREVGKLMPIEP
jgi:hypothetical protein